MRFLGRGGTGSVFEASDEELSIPVAIKALDSGIGQTEDALWRLKREVLLARAVWHPHVCRVYDLGRHGEGEQAIWFLTMELLDGETLRERLVRRGRMTPVDALPLVEHMAAGLGAAHRAGVVHGDFTPGNVMLVQGPQRELAIVTDFGLGRPAAAAFAGESQGAELAAVMGTPAYMAPERVLGEDAQPASDIYALGAVMYQMVTGSLPFTGPSAYEAVLMRLVRDAPSPRLLVPELSERWESVILRCLSREPGDRFARPEEIAEALSGQAPVVGIGALRRGLRVQSVLPAERDVFVGREAELAEIEACFAGGSRVVVLLGAAGMGKTRIAVHFGWQSLERWPGGAWFCDLTDAKDGDGIATSVAGALGVPLGRGDAMEQLGYAIAGRGRCLVILDNFEQVAGHTGELERWLERARQASFLVTSRERLDLRGQAVRVVEPLSIASGVELFIARARQQRPGLQLDASDLETVREVVRTVEGMPLAIELAAARLRLMTVTEISARMRDGFRVLGGEGHGRHGTLRAAIDGSWDLLRPWEKAAWTQCAAFEGGFTLEAAEGVLNLGAWRDAPWVVDVVQSLVDKSLIRSWVPEGPTHARMREARFGMYASLQQYALEKLRTEGAVPGGGSGPQAERTLAERHGKWYARFGTVDALEALHGHGGPVRWWRLQREMENLVLACRRAVARADGAIATATYCAIGEIVELQGPYGVAVELGRELIATPLAREDMARALGTLGEVERLRGLTDRSSAHLTEALALQCETSDRIGEGRIRNSLGKLNAEQGSMEEARLHYEAALGIYRKARARRLEGVVLGNLAGLHHELGWMKEATREFEAALAIHREVGDRRLEAIALGNLGVNCLDRGRMDEARSFLEASLAITREVGDRRAEGIVIGNLGNLYLERGRTEEALATYETSLVIRREVGDRRSEGLALSNVGRAHLEAGRWEEARSHLETALPILREVHDRRAEGALFGSLSEIHLAQGRIEEAREALAQGEALLREVDDPLEIGKLLSVRSELERRSGDMAAAGQTLIEAEGLARLVGAEAESELAQRLSRLRLRLAMPHTVRPPLEETGPP